MHLRNCFAALAICLGQSAGAAEAPPKSIAARVEAIPVQTLTISDQQFLSGDAFGGPTTIAGVLRIAQGSGRLPVVIFIAGSGGFNANTDVWDRQFLEMGISTFALDAFAGRGITSVVQDQSQIGRLNAILDVYRSLAVLAAHPRVDPNRIAVMGFSRGGQAALYASVRRFQKLWNAANVEPAAYFALYPQCTTTFIADTEVSEHPIRIFHGIPDDYNEIAPCRRYFERLKSAAKDVKMTEFPDTAHAYDFPLFSTTPTVVQNGQTLHCPLVEGPIGVIINTETQKPFTFGDACVGRNPHVGYSAAATHATEDDVKGLLKALFKLN
jgi:dienelactone hydrolase